MPGRVCAAMVMLLALEQGALAQSQCSAHYQCTSIQYCDTANDCFACAGCAQYQDPVDGQCPSNCGTSGGGDSSGCSRHSQCGSGQYCDVQRNCLHC